MVFGEVFPDSQGIKSLSTLLSPGKRTHSYWFDMAQPGTKKRLAESILAITKEQLARHNFLTLSETTP